MYFTLSESVSDDVVDRGASGGSVAEPIANDAQWIELLVFPILFFIFLLFTRIFSFCTYLASTVDLSSGRSKK